MTEKRYKSVGANLKCRNGMEYMLIKRTDGYNVCQVCSKYTAKEIVDELNSIAEENEQLKSENEQLKQKNSVFGGEDAKHYQRWVNQIKKYVEETNPDFEYNEDFIIKIALSYTLQSLRNSESLKRFQWDYEELEE